MIARCPARGARFGPILLLVLPALLASASCSSPPATLRPGTEARGRTLTSIPDLEQHASGLMARARLHEASLTRRLKRLAADYGGTLIGLEHRFKTHRSLVRKIELVLTRGKVATPRAVKISDALRYTLRVSDSPAGHYVAAIHSVLADLERAGHRVIRLKNYWPRGDNYSGVNCTLSTPDRFVPNGFFWELQFHTTGSIGGQKATRAQYEQLRARETPVAKKRMLFDAMARTWEKIPLPEGILTPKNLHAKEEIIRLSRP